MARNRFPPAVAVHGGAWNIPDDEVPAHEEACAAALRIARSILEVGGSAREAALASVVLLENHPGLNAGTGAVLTRDGHAELDAGVMDGDGRWAAVAGIKRFPNPVRIAAELLDTGDALLLAADGAEQFARDRGFVVCDPKDLVVERERQRLAAQRAREAPKGTVGVVARDREGRFFAATSTGGRPGKPAGRVGDTPIVGCGFLAGPNGAVVCTGEGEPILTFGLAREIYRSRSPAGALEALRVRLQGTAGTLVLTRRGPPRVVHTTPRMAAGVWSLHHPEVVAVQWPPQAPA